MWFAKALSQAGHHVVMPLRGAAGSYVSGARATRVAALGQFGDVVWDCSFGSANFLAVARTGQWDLLCHHAAQVGDYHSAEFDVAGALAENTREFPSILRAMSGLHGVVVTGSVFEQDEGAGTPPMNAFSAYGLSKGLTVQAIRYQCATVGINLGKFTIPNPFGPFEEPRFCAYLARSFLKGEVPDVRTPLYVRDNIHVDLLAARYAMACTEVASATAPLRFNPSGYVESQGRFARRFAEELSSRLGRTCAVTLGLQTELTEPIMRINTIACDGEVPDWNETAAWNAVAEYALQHYKP
jgi:UDP-glucose 4-epimerase